MVGRETIRRGLTWLLAIALVASLVTIAAIAIDPPETTDPYTEFYILGPDGNASDYPANLTTGGSGDIIVGVTNHEHRDVEYTMQVTWNGTVTQERVWQVADEETLERPVTLTAPDEPGRYRVRFELFLDEASGEPYRYLRLWVTVREQAAIRAF